MNPKIAQEMVGHQHYSTTVDIFMHVTKPTNVNEATKFGLALIAEEDDD